MCSVVCMMGCSSARETGRNKQVWDSGDQCAVACWQNNSSWLSTPDSLTPSAQHKLRVVAVSPTHFICPLSLPLPPSP